MPGTTGEPTYEASRRRSVVTLIPLGAGRGVASVQFVGEETVVSVGGNLDALSVPELGHLLDSVVNDIHPSVVLDLGDLNTIGSSGVALIADTAQRLRGGGRSLTVRSPSPAVRRMLAAAGLSDLIRPGRSRPGGEQGPRRPDHPGPSPLAIEPGATVPQLTMAWASPTRWDLVDAALRMAVELARATVGGADGVSVSIKRHGRLATVAATDQTILDMDARQYATGEGPCVDASIKGRWFHAPSLDAEERWPSFVPKAKALGINAILSSPLFDWRRPVGALNIYSHSPSAFAAADLRLASTFAAEASTVLTDAGIGLTDTAQSDRFGAALRTREIIAQAQGVIMEREGINEDDAYTVLRIYSQRTGRPLRERAEQIASSALRSQGTFGPAHDADPRHNEPE